MTVVCHDHDIRASVVKIDQPLEKPAMLHGPDTVVVSVRDKLETIAPAQREQQQTKDDRRVRRDDDFRSLLPNDGYCSTSASQVSHEPAAIVADLLNWNSEFTRKRFGPQMTTPVDPKKGLPVSISGINARRRR